MVSIVVAREIPSLPKHCALHVCRTRLYRGGHRADQYARDLSLMIYFYTGVARALGERPFEAPCICPGKFDISSTEVCPRGGKAMERMGDNLQAEAAHLHAHIDARKKLIGRFRWVDIECVHATWRKTH